MAQEVQYIWKNERQVVFDPYFLEHSIANADQKKETLPPTKFREQATRLTPELQRSNQIITSTSLPPPFQLTPPPAFHLL